MVIDNCTVPSFPAASIPPYATGPALILVGALMVVNIVKIDWDNVQVRQRCYESLITAEWLQPRGHYYSTQQINLMQRTNLVSIKI